jgi:protein-L-isoaspartate(D-aspartate) O-methyltransferase
VTNAIELRVFAEMAASMVETQLRQRGIRDARVLDAMSRLPRHEFVAENRQAESYSDSPLAIGYGQTISQPYITALMAELLELSGDEKVLDVGSGSGYAAALLGALAREVISIERIPELAAIARANLRKTGLDSNITVICGDGSLGAREYAPFNAIFVAAASPRIPAALTAQLADPGILVIPAGTRKDQELQVVRKELGKLTTLRFSGCRFVPLLGRDAF